jgi:hypothetical protein
MPQIASIAEAVIRPDGTTSEAPRASRVAPLDENGRARYFVILQGDPVASTAGVPMLKGKKRKDMASQAAHSRLDALKSQQTRFVSSATTKLGRTIEPLMQFQHALNAVVVELTPAEAATIAAQPGVVKVNREEFKQLQTYNTHTLIGADTIWTGTSTPSPAWGPNDKLLSQGEGMVIGEIDSGVNWTSKSFAATGSDGYTVQNPLGTGNFLGNCLASGTVKNGYASKGTDYSTTTPHCNDKLIGIYNTEFNGTTYNPASGQDLNGHGSHTASTAGGNVVNGAPYALGTFNVSGVAPHANIIAYLACGTASYSCANTGLAAAYNQAVQDNIVDAINYSIGGPEQSPWDDTVQQAALNAMAAGIFVAQAAGNDGPDAGSITGNASPWTTTVAASTPAKMVSFSFGLSSVNGSTSVPANTQNLQAIPGSAPLPTQNYTNLPLIVSPNFANGSTDGCTAYPANTFRKGGVAGGAQGIAVLHLDQNASNCASGTRRTAAANAGALAVIYVDDNFISLGASGASYSVLMSDWNKILAAPGIDVSSASGNAIASIGPSSVYSRTPDLVTSYSSRGPVPFAALKPDIAAPGDLILAAMSPTATSGYSTANQAASSVIYGIESGTSMATPHITGSSVLVKAIHPNWTPMQIKSAMMTTATKAYTTDGSAEADPTVAGAGRIDLTEATRASLLFDETATNFTNANPDAGGDPSQLNLASYYHFNCVGTCSFPRTVSSALPASGNWTIAVTGLPDGSYSLDKTSLSLAGGASTSYTLSIDATKLTEGQWTYGKLTLTSSDSTLPVQHLPIAIRSSTPALRASPTPLAAHAAVGQTVTQPLTVGNAGNQGLNWSISTTTLKAPLTSNPYNDAANGIPGRTVVTSGTSTAITSTNANNYYEADYFDIFAAGTTVDSVSLYGFGYNSTNGAVAASTIVTQLALRIYADNGSNQPSGRPGVTTDTAPIYQFPAAAGGLGPTAAGVSFGGGASWSQSINLNLAAASAPTATMTTPGRYWVSMTPSMTSANTWYQGDSISATKSPPGQFSAPNATGANAVLKPWNATTNQYVFDDPTYTGWALRVMGTAVCSAPWLSYDTTSGNNLGLNGSQTVNVSFNATGLVVGTYKAYVCVSANGTSPTNVFTTDEDAILIPVTFNVVNVASPVCTASPNPAGGTQMVTINCSGADAGTTNTIPGATCSPNPTTDGTFTCTGIGSDIGSNPTLTSSTTAGDSTYVVVPLTVDTTAPLAPNCSANPAAAVSGTSVTVTCTSVGTGSTNSFPNVSCTPNPADATGTITCTGNAENFGTNPVLTTVNTLNNSSQATVSFTLLAQYSVTTSGGVGGTVSAPAQSLVTAGQSTTFTVSPLTGYSVGSVVGTTCSPSPQSGNTWTTGAINADCAITATFSELPGSISVGGVGNGDNSPTTGKGTDFGKVAIGNTASHGFTISNGGVLQAANAGHASLGSGRSSPSAAGDLTISSITSSNSAFTVSGGTGTIASGGSTAFNVTFNATSVGTKNATITIHSNDVTAPTYTFAVTAQAVAGDAQTVTAPILDAKSMLLLAGVLAVFGQIMLSRRKSEK